MGYPGWQNASLPDKNRKRLQAAQASSLAVGIHSCLNGNRLKLESQKADVPVLVVIRRRIKERRRQSAHT
jgi:hypothetical protein